MLKQNSILVIRLSSLGDVLMTAPAVQAIRNRLPEAHISWLVEGSVGEFLKCQEFIDDVIAFPRSATVRELKKGSVSGAGRRISPFLRHLREREYGTILDFHGIAKSVLLMKAARGKNVIGFGVMFAKEKSHLFYDTKIEWPDTSIHKVERNMLIARHLGCQGDPPAVAFQTSPDATAYIDTFLRERGGPPLFAVNPFSSKGTDFKRWPLERYAGLLARIHRELHEQTVILWGPGEEEEARRLKEMSGEGTYLACPTTIPQLFALLRKIRVYIGGDTGVMHLAAAAGTQVAAIFGPTDYRVNGPYGKDHTIIREDVPCSPCKKKNCSDRQCLTPITVDRVFETIHTLLAKNRTN